MSIMDFMVYFWSFVIFVGFLGLTYAIIVMLYINFHPNYGAFYLWILEQPFKFLRYQKYAKLFTVKKCVLNSENLRFLKKNYPKEYSLFKQLYNEIELFRFLLIYLQENHLFQYVFTPKNYNTSWLRIMFLDYLFFNIFANTTRINLPFDVPSKYRVDIIDFYDFMIYTQNLYGSEKYNFLSESNNRAFIDDCCLAYRRYNVDQIHKLIGTVRGHSNLWIN